MNTALRPASTPRGVTRHRPAPAVAAAQSRWSHAERQVRQSLRDLQVFVHDRCASEPDLRDIDDALERAITEIEADLQAFGQPLQALLRRLAAAPSSDEQQRIVRDVQALLQRHRTELPSSELLRLFDDNGFLQLELQRIVQVALSDLERQMAAMARPSVPPSAPSAPSARSARSARSA